MLVSRACVLVILVISVPDTLDYLDYMRRIPTGVMRLPTGLVFGVYMVFCVGLPLKIAITYAGSSATTGMMRRTNSYEL